MSIVKSDPTYKFIADVNIEKTLIEDLAAKGHDIKWIPDYDCGLPDSELLRIANKERRILLTNDKDFGELVFLQKKISSGIILIRIKKQDVGKKRRNLEKLLTNHGDKLYRHFIVVGDNKIRIIPMEDMR